MSATNLISNPFPLSKIGPGASFATVSTPITTNYADLATLTVDSIIIQAHPDNTGNCYLVNSATQPDTTNYVGVLQIIPPGGLYSNNSSAMNTIGPLSAFYIGADDAASFCLVSVRFR